MNNTTNRVRLAPLGLNGARLWVIGLIAPLLGVFIHAPVMLLITRHGRWDLFAAWFFGVESLRFLLFYVFVMHLKHPRFMVRFRELCGGPRIYIPAAMASFAFSNPPLSVYVILLALWIGLEIWAMRWAKKITTAAAFRELKRTKALQKQGPGEWRYALDGGYSRLLDKLSPSGQFMERSMKIGIPLLLLGPGLFMLSHRAGDNFELRTFIFGCICIFLGYITMPALIDSSVSRRTLRALEQGELA